MILLILLQHPTILFAGEAAHPIHFSTTHGAFETGQYQAKRVLEFMMDSQISSKENTDKIPASDTIPPSPLKSMTAAAVG